MEQGKLDFFDEAQRLGWDRSDMGRLIAGFPGQCREAMALVKNWPAVSKPKPYRQVIICGMGGSAIAGDIAAAWGRGGLGLPLVTHRNYGLPGGAGQQDLIILSSYSGETEETLSAYQEAGRLGAEMLAITTGGRLEQWCWQDGVPMIKIPSGMAPRCALGYSFFALIFALERYGLMTIDGEQVEEAAAVMEAQGRECHWSAPAGGNEAKKLASQMSRALVVIYASADHLHPVARRWANQINENAKHFAYTAAFPELCHNEIVAWEDGGRLANGICLVMLEDRDDHPRNRIRQEAVREIIGLRAGTMLRVFSRGDSLLARMFSLIHLGDWVSYYLARLNDVDPTPIPPIVKLKEILKSKK